MQIKVNSDFWWIRTGAVVGLAGKLDRMGGPIKAQGSLKLARIADAYADLVLGGLRHSGSEPRSRPSKLPLTDLGVEATVWSDDRYPAAEFGFEVANVRVSPESG